MGFTPTDATAWQVFGNHTVCRYLEPGAAYRPDAPWPTSGGRFDNGVRATLYVSAQADAAVAEYLRRHPELIDFQDALKLRVYEFELNCSSAGCDVRRQQQAVAVGISVADLTSSHVVEAARYSKCRKLAAAVDDAGGIGIAFPSAAFTGAHNFVLFHDAAPGWWTTAAVAMIETPYVDPERLRLLARSE